MSLAVARLLRTNYEAFSTGNPNPLLESLSEDITWHVSGGSPLAGEYTGKDDVISFFQKMGQLYGGSLSVEVLDVLASDNHGAVLTLEELQYQGRPLSFSSVHLWEVRDGKFSSFRVRYDDAYHKFWPLR
ncbi:MAG TPA: nuclear transport factor 2 family protein [Gemmatimonadaceae bacterium]|nr:nuclear transport factor 2 family protein [Gemmatimonadaceae bacterium]